MAAAIEYEVIINSEEIRSNNWGEFEVSKQLHVKSNIPIDYESPNVSSVKNDPKNDPKNAPKNAPVKNNKTRRSSRHTVTVAAVAAVAAKPKTKKRLVDPERVDRLQKNVHGFIIQHVKKQTHAYVLTDRGIKKINKIDAFTNNHVKYANDSYFEVFPVIHGVALNNDKFTNGPILQYKLESFKSKGKLRQSWIADNNPPTMGNIIVTGSLFFIPKPQREVLHVVSELKSKSNPIHAMGVDWNASADSPANGLLFTMSPDVNRILLDQKRSNILIHQVKAIWDGIQDPRFNSHRVTGTNVPVALDESNNNSNRREANATTSVLVVKYTK